ncbi:MULTISPECIES: HAD family hydrolase [Nitrospirillum]|uniref:Putative hydrolase of the HAD superfamily n=1 Tax=Nitrospirillum amazonense TaxID=28077 RepID=A0A560F6V0_9PROT|nr:HAD family hydrolase [Nitrospirillum amazonense]TWB17347.1 putative hydrolase of the HAD superfamily [Nitrospirillum amazonense]TWB73162.1 putative hydrolase of the HAD superfamily [Nitrospirillum amazonense]
MSPAATRPLPPRVIALDGDDTLWHNEAMFSTSYAEFRDLLLRHSDLDQATIDERLLLVERRNLVTYGYGIKGFTLSMIETALELTEGRIPGIAIEMLVQRGRAMLAHPVELIDGAVEVIETLRQRDHEVWLITKGDLFDQESKIARSGLADLFHRIEIVSEKDDATYRRLLDRHGVAPADFAMAGNSLKSDVLPVAALGGQGFHVPYHTTWAHEMVSGPIPHPYTELASLRELPSALGSR